MFFFCCNQFKRNHIGTTPFWLCLPHPKLNPVLKCISNAAKVSICEIYFEVQTQTAAAAVASAPAKVNDMRAFKQFYALKPENHLWLWCIEQYQPKDLNHMHRWMMVFTHHFYLLFLLRVTQQPRALTICTYTRNCFSFFFSHLLALSVR